MKILQISNYYLPHIGGIEQVAYDLSTILKDKGNETCLICFNDCKETVIEQYDNQKIIRVGYKLKLFSQAISIKYFFLLKKLIKDFNPDWIHIHFPNPLIALYLNILSPKCHISIHWHSDIVNQKQFKLFFSPIEKRSLKRAEKIITTTQIYADNSDSLKPFLSKVSVIPCIVNDAFLDELTTDEKNKIQEIKQLYSIKKIVYSMGVHRTYKGLIHLIEAARYLPNNYVVIIAGSGPLTDELKNVAKQYNLNNVIFIGRVTDSEKKCYFYASDVFAFPSISKNEAFGIALAESLYCGCPAVTFTINGSGVNYVNQNGKTGLEVNTFDDKKYAEALIEVSKEKYGNNAHNWAKENFTRNAIEDKVIKFFSEK